jgi:hypothetical protein
MFLGALTRPCSPGSSGANEDAAEVTRGISEEVVEERQADGVEDLDLRRLPWPRFAVPLSTPFSGHTLFAIKRQKIIEVVSP